MDAVAIDISIWIGIAIENFLSGVIELLKILVGIGIGCSDANNNLTGIIYSCDCSKANGSSGGTEAIKTSHC